MINFLKLRSSFFNEMPFGNLTKSDDNILFKKKETTKKADKKSKDKTVSNAKVKASTGGPNNKRPNDEEDGKEIKNDNESDIVEIDEVESNENDSNEEDSNDNTIVGPWGSISNSNDQENNDSSNRTAEKNKYENLINDLVNKNSFVKKQPKKPSGGGFGGGNSGNQGGGSFGDNFFNNFDKSPKKMLLAITLIAASLWMATGFYKVNSDQNALVLYFGKYHSIATPGLNYRLPYPIGKVIKQSVTTVNSEEFGYRSKSNAPRRIARRSNLQQSDDSENLMLTGDENIVDIEFQVQWQVKDIEKFTFNISNPRLTIRKAAESAMREVIAVTPISEALSDGKSRIEQESRKLLQEILDDYGAGIRIVLLQLRRVDPPIQVIDSFRDVQTARADKEKEINEAQAYANDIIPRARGNAAEMQEKALAYKSRITSDAQGEANRFLALHRQYKYAKQVTRKRMYLETMQKVYGDIDKVIIDNKVSKGSLMPYFPLGDLNKGNSSAARK